MNSLSALGVSQRSLYATTFLVALLCASFFPLVLSVVHFDITDARFAAGATVFSFIAILSGVHVWMTIPYYLNRRWLAYFITRPFDFFVVPALITAFFIACALQPVLWIGLAPVYAITFVNLWHHAKQNWGVLSMTSKIEHGDVTAIQKPIIWAWPFFVLPWAMTMPFLPSWAGSILWPLSLLSVAAYLAYAGLAAVRGGFLDKNQPTIVLLMGTAVMLYFVPLVFLRGRPYYVAIWAFAHGLQYYLLVSMSLALHKRNAHPFWRLALAGAGAVIVLGALTLIAHLAATHSASAMSVWGDWRIRLVLELAAAVNLIHFWVDRFIWKFSDKDIRALHGHAFNFS